MWSIILLQARIIIIIINVYKLHLFSYIHGASVTQTLRFTLNHFHVNAVGSIRSSVFGEGYPGNLRNVNDSTQVPICVCNNA
jgi:hypothetical protein